MSAQLRLVRGALGIRAAELKYDLWGSIVPGTKIYSKVYIATPPQKADYIVPDPTDITKQIKDEILKMEVVETWKVEM